MKKQYVEEEEKLDLGFIPKKKIEEANKKINNHTNNIYKNLNNELEELDREVEKKENKTLIEVEYEKDFKKKIKKEKRKNTILDIFKGIVFLIYLIFLIGISGYNSYKIYVLHTLVKTGTAKVETELNVIKNEIYKEIEATRKITEEQYLLEEKILETKKSVEDKRKESNPNIEEINKMNESLILLNKELVKSKEKITDTTNKNDIDSKKQEISYIEETYLINLSKDENIINIVYKFSTNDKELLNSVKEKISKKEKYSNTRINEKNENEILADIKGEEGKKISEIINNLSKNILVGEYTFVEQNVNTKLKN
jgi:hypothetical protein